jgi:hypothetical protein
MIEHSFRHLYIYVRALNDNNDDTGKRYYETLRGNEDLESFDKISNYSKVVYPEKTKWNTKGEHNNAIRQVGKEFHIERIFYYLVANNNKTKLVERFKKEYLLQRLTEYTKLSSAVHGGPFGEAVFVNLQGDKEKLNKQLNRFSVDSFWLHKSLVESTYLFAYLMDDKMQKHYENISNVGARSRRI